MRGFRITVVILGLALGLAMFIQTSLVYSLSSLFNTGRSTTESGAAGVAMALMWLLAVSLVFPLPVASLATFGIAAIVGFIASPSFPDLAIWAVASLLLAGISGIAWWETKEVAKEKAEEKEMLQTILRIQMQHGGPMPQSQVQNGVPMPQGQGPPHQGWQAPPGYGYRQG